MKINLLKTAILAVAMTVCNLNICGQQSGVLMNNRTYMLVTSEKQLEEGQYLIVGYKSQESANATKTIRKGYYALGVQQSSNNRLGIFIDSVSEDSIPPQIINTEIALNKSDSLPFEITLGRNDDKWTLFDILNSNGYLGPDTTVSSLNYLRPNKNVIPLYDITIEKDYLAVMACVAPIEARSGSGRDTVRFNQGGNTSTSLNNPVFASYKPTVRTNANSAVYLYKQVNLSEFWLPENQAASFAGNAWRVKFDNSENWEKDENGNFLHVSIPQNNSQIQKIKISGEVTTGNNMASSYATEVLEIESKGSLNVSAGTLHVSEKVVMLSEDNHSAQLKSTNGMLIANELQVKKTFRNAVWYHVSFPFDVEKIHLNKTDGSQIENVTVNPNVIGTGKGVWAKYYNGKARSLAENNSEHYNTSSSINWVSIPPESKLKANKGYQFGQNHGVSGSIDTLIFVSRSPAPESAWSATEKWYEVIPHQASVFHRGWNLIGNPHTFSYHLQDKLSDYITYVYNESSNDYIEDTEIILPFKAFFVQTEEDKIAFHHHGNMAMLRSFSVAPYEQIQLSITKDSLFFDYFNLRIGGENATTGFDFNRDAHKMLSNTNPQIYSRFHHIDYAINTIPDTEKSVPISFKVPSAGNYTVRLDKNNLSGNVAKLLLLDKEKYNLTTDLLVTPFYEFSTTGAQTNTARFELLFELLDDNTPQPAGLASHAATGNKIAVVFEDNKLTVTGLERLSTVTIYDVAGRMIQIFTKVENNRKIILTKKISGIYIVKIENESQTETMKIIVRQTN